MNENEEFEFRHRMEREAQTAGATAVMEPPAETRDPRDFAGNDPRRSREIMAGIAAGPIKAYLAGKQLLTGLSPEERDIERQNQEAAEKSPIANFVGNTAMLAVPSSMAFKAMPAVAGTLGLTGKAATIAGNALAGGTTAGGAAALNPVASDDNIATEKAKQIGKEIPMGVALGAGLPLAAQGVRHVGREVGDWINKSWNYIPFPTALGGRSLETAAKNVTQRGYQELPERMGQSRDAVAKALLAKQSPLAGQSLTSAQALAGDVEGAAKYAPMANLEKQLAQTVEGSSVLRPKYLEQHQVRDAALKTIAPQWPSQDFAMETRAALTDPIYAKAEQEVVKIDSGLRDILKRVTAKKDLMEEAKALAKLKGDPFPAAKERISIKQLDYIKKALTDAAEQKPVANQVGKELAHSYGDLRRDLLDWMGNNSNTYGLAQRTFKQASGPVHRTGVREAFQSELTNPMGKETAVPFVKSADDSVKLLKDATGRNFKTVEDAVLPQEAQTVRQVEADVKRAWQAANPPAVSIPAGSGFTEGQKVDIPNFLNSKRMLAEAIFGQRAKAMTPLVNRLSAELHVDRNKMAEIIRMPSNQAASQYPDIVKALMRQAPAQYGMQAGGRQ